MESPAPPVRQTLGSVRVEGHFGELLQGRLGPDGPVVLVTLPCPRMAVRARLTPGHPFSLHGRAATLGPPGQVVRFLAALGLRPRGRVVMTSAAAPGLGTGVSTARLVAAARLFGWVGPPEALARACVEAEGASDPLMLPESGRLLWASREGRIVRMLPPMPRFDIVGGFYGPALPTDPADRRYPDIADLLDGWSPALHDLAARASESARRTLALRGPADDPTEALARQLGALGWQISHSGAARGLIFAPGTAPPDAEAQMERAGLRQTFRFTAGDRG